ncbi:aldo/keto reductase [bacterium]|nr:aldo/keto reductase [bacterium]
MLTIGSTTQLNNGVEIPLFGLGLYLSPEGEVARQAVRMALEAGYRHFDTAAFYANERSVGEAIRASGIPRSDIFVTTKLWNSDHGYGATLRAFEISQQKFDLDYIDLYLIHWPVQKKRLDSWRALERLLDEGRCKSIGVSNYMVRHLEELLAHCNVKPTINQIELSPYNYLSRREVVEFCRENDIQIESYSPLTKGEKLNAPKLRPIANKHNKTNAQILLRWHLERKFVVIPKSARKERIYENADVFDFSLSQSDMNYLDHMDENLVTSWDPTDAP